MQTEWDQLCSADLESYTVVDELLESAIPDHQFVLAFDNYQIDNRIVYAPNNWNHFMSKVYIHFEVTKK